MADIYMKAPKGMTSAEIEGNEYEIPKNGIIKVRNVGHVETLKRHGFVESDKEGEPNFEEMEDAELVTYIEEHGGEADTSMKRKRLLRLAAEAYSDSQEG